LIQEIMSMDLTSCFTTISRDRVSTCELSFSYVGKARFISSLPKT